MNPAIDLATRVERVVPTDKMRCATPRFDPGGAGINIARTAAELGVEVTAGFPTGSPSDRPLEQLVRDTGVPPRPVQVAESTRESARSPKPSAASSTDSSSRPEAHRPGTASLLGRGGACGARRELPRGQRHSATGYASSDFYQTLTDLAGELGSIRTSVRGLLSSNSSRAVSSVAGQDRDISARQGDGPRRRCSSRALMTFVPRQRGIRPPDYLGCFLRDWWCREVLPRDGTNRPADQLVFEREPSV
ncbi:PfkB family carbohydrate kinase [Nocardia barduliensis]|uniref:PfkB family carbohydrate kinase n=1 Tax=Nocardia barduliensis TaxID=2736643 RepID=UPI0034D98160